MRGPGGGAVFFCVSAFMLGGWGVGRGGGGWVGGGGVGGVGGGGAGGGGRLSSVAQPLSFVVLGSVIHSSALTGKGICFFWPTFIVSPL